MSVRVMGKIDPKYPNALPILTYGGTRQEGMNLVILVSRLDVQNQEYLYQYRDDSGEIDPFEVEERLRSHL